MIAQVVGKDKPYKGVSKKTGNDFVRTVLHCVSAENEKTQYFTGYRVAEIPCFFDVEHVQVGQTYEFIYESKFGGVGTPRLVDIVAVKA